MEMDPYYLAPLGADPLTFAALQARAVIEAGIADERDDGRGRGAVRRDGKSNPHAQVTGDFDVDQLLHERLRARAAAPPRRPADHRRRRARWCSPPRDRARAAAWSGRRSSPASTTAPSATTRRSATSTDSPSTRIAAEAAGLGDGPVEVAELQAAFTHEELLLRQALGLGDDGRR